MRTSLIMQIMQPKIPDRTIVIKETDGFREGRTT